MNDKRGLIVVTTAIVLAFVIACVFVRCWQRLEAKEWHLEDLAFASSAVQLSALHSTIEVADLCYRYSS